MLECRSRSGVLCAACLFFSALLVPVISAYSEDVAPPFPPIPPNVKLSAEIFKQPLDPQELPILDGSTSAVPIRQLMVAEALGLQAGLGRWVSGSGTFVKTYQNVSLELQAALMELTELRVVNSGTNGAYVKLIHGLRDIVIVARKPSPDELELAEAGGVKLDARPCALDAFIFITHWSNPVASLTLDQIRGIYTGKITNWNEVGGNDLPIIAFGRERNSGSEELMRELVMEGEPSIGQNRMSYSMMGPFDALEETPGGIAYTVNYFERVLNPQPYVKVLAVEGVLPQPSSIGRGRPKPYSPLEGKQDPDPKYPLITEVYVVVREGTPEDHPAVLLRDYLLSQKGQWLIRRSGYQPIPIVDGP